MLELERQCLSFAVSVMAMDVLDTLIARQKIAELKREPHATTLQRCQSPAMKSCHDTCAVRTEHTQHHVFIRVAKQTKKRNQMSYCRVASTRASATSSRRTLRGDPKLVQERNLPLARTNLPNGGS